MKYFKTWMIFEGPNNCCDNTVTILNLMIGTSTWIYIALNGTNLIEIDRLRSNIFIT